MGFPGRLHEKKKHSLGLYIVTGVVIFGIAWAIWQVVQVVRKPLEIEREAPVHNKTKPGYVVKKADKFSADVNQILHGDPLKPVPEKSYAGKAVTYEAPSGAKAVTAPEDYYSATK